MVFDIPESKMVSSVNEPGVINSATLMDGSNDARANQMAKNVEERRVLFQGADDTIKPGSSGRFEPWFQKDGIENNARDIVDLANKQLQKDGFPNLQLNLDIENTELQTNDPLASVDTFKLTLKDQGKLTDLDSWNVRYGSFG